MSHYDEQRKASIGLKPDWCVKDDETPKQVGGTHYRSAIQPVAYIKANRLGFLEGNIIKYVTRYKQKGGMEDLRKAKHYLEMLIEDQL